MDRKNVAELSLVEKVFVVKSFYQTQNNILAAFDKFKKEFGVLVPDTTLHIFMALVVEFERSGSVTQPVFYYCDKDAVIGGDESEVKIEDQSASEEEEFDEIVPNTSSQIGGNSTMGMDSSHGLLMMFSEPLLEAENGQSPNRQIIKRRKRRTKEQMREARLLEETRLKEKQQIQQQIESEDEDDFEENEVVDHRRVDSKWGLDISNTARTLKERCKCRTDEKTKLKCHLVTEKDRQILMEHFWSLSWKEKSAYVNEMILLMPTRFKKRGQNGEAIESRRSQTLEYYMNSTSGTVRVCKTMFSNTFDIPKATVWNWKANQGQATNLERKRVKRGSRGQKMLRKPEGWETMKRFFEHLPKTEFEADAVAGVPKRSYLSKQWTTKRLLHQYYKDWCSGQNAEQLSMAVFSTFMAQRNILLMKEEAK